MDSAFTMAVLGNDDSSINVVLYAVGQKK